MRQRFRLIIGAILVVALSGSTDAKGRTIRITITGADLAAPIEITAPELVRQFGVWEGPGVRVNGAEQKDGFVIDWRAGVVQPPDGLDRYEVSFYVESRNTAARELLVYVVAFAFDPASGHGYIYLPGRGEQWYGLNTKAIYRSLEGNWFRASTAWQQAAAPLMTRARR
jgi:hypothetical protein